LHSVAPGKAVAFAEILQAYLLNVAGSYHCDGASPGGFAPGPGDRSHPPSKWDCCPQDWKLSVTELALALDWYKRQLPNAGGRPTPKPDTTTGMPWSLAIANAASGTRDS